MQLATALVYWMIVALWLAVLGTVCVSYARNPRTFGATRLLLIVVAIDTVRNIVENLYFGLYFGAQYGLFPGAIVTQYKGRNRKPHRLTLPILPALQSIIDASPCGDLTFLVNERGRPFTDAGFGNKMREWCDQAGLPHCAAHGLRKAGATIAAENGATARQLMAIFGWDSIEQAELYTRSADQVRLAGSAMHLLESPGANEEQK